MINKLPQNTKSILVTNGVNSIQGLLSYTKNIDLDEKGYIKLAAPMLKIYSSEVAEGGDTGFELPTTLFNWDEGKIKVITQADAYNIINSSLSVTKDTGYTVWNLKSRVISWVGGLWHIGGGDVKSYSGATATTVYATVINILLNYIELFVNRNTIIGSNSDNTLKQYDTSYANTQDLTIPANFIITGTAYSNNRIGIITRQTKNQGNAYFFTWTGDTSSAESGYPVNDSYILAIKAYKSSWAIFTSSGQLLYFNGGGFTELGTIPTFRFEDDAISLGPNSSITVGDIMDVDGDLIYINCASLPEFSMDNKPYRPGFSGGVYCYDPEVGFYHKFAPSYSRYIREDLTASSNILTASAAHLLKTGDEVWLQATDLGLTGARTYFAIVVNSTTFKLADTYNDAISETSLSITNGTLNNVFWAKRVDYGVESIGMVDLGLVKKSRDYNGFDSSGVMPTFMGVKIHPNDLSITPVSVLNASVPIMSNIGYCVTSKFQSDDFEEQWKGIAVKYLKLSQQSSITVRAKIQDREAVIVGDMNLFDSTYSGASVNWDASGDYFETTFDLTDVEVGDRIRIFAGAGAGQSAHITEIAETGGVWQVTIDASLRGITSNAKSCISIEKYHYLGTITATDTDGVKYFALGKSSPTLEIELELKGIGVRISEILPISIKHTSEV